MQELSVFGPVILGVRIPVHGHFEHLEHRKGPLLLQLVVNVEEGTNKAIVCH